MLKTLSKNTLLILSLVLVFSLAGCKKNNEEIIQQSENQIQEESQIQAAEEWNAEEVLNIQHPEVDTSDWKTYRDKKYGFEFKYPKDWEIREAFGPAIGGDYSNIIFEKNRSMGLNVFKTNLDPEAWLLNEHIGGLVVQGKCIVASGYDCYYVKVDYKNAHATHSYIISNGKILIIFDFSEKYYTRNDETNEYEEVSFSKYLPEFKTLVGSLRFKE